MSVKVFRGKCANVGNLYFDIRIDVSASESVLPMNIQD